MHEFHGWFGISESAYEADEGTLAEGLAELRARVAELAWSMGTVRVVVHNAREFLEVNGVANRRGVEAMELDRLLEHVATRFPGSYGLLYERSDDPADFDTPGVNAFRVRVMARGEIHTRLDPFLSPCNPVIED
ncbi:Imm7 family immunity protein [Kutzneria sp. 744]|uniref:Imm7 family immunity protein n=1 Tax=Kutzneria sp. (strain 744) TaxID=345341 RepID=UPI0003EEAD9C|nr:Imm7 family immunity protein [Kutzneria sp. 744]EWM10537.1 hypothetical protein KUTG_00841 [Kutzneria sp. 744]